MTPLEILQKQFGYPSFRYAQEAIINSVLDRQDTFVLMPTGGGKSVCYQIPALLFDGLTLVISPLIALMKDQVDALRVNGIPAAYLNSTQDTREQEAILEKIRTRELKLLYVAPERLLKSGGNFLEKVKGFNLSLIAIDEAHCISHWGHDFRPEYLMLAQLKRALPDVPVIALTATADHLTRKDIIEKLELKNPATFVASFNRPNIRYTVEPKKNSLDRLLEFLSTRKNESGIIYCLSRASTERLAADLSAEGYTALPYHAGLDRELRARHQEMFLRDDVNIIVATIAFGMGIDKSNVRFVVHMDLPKNIESYYQETGRAGRDGLESEALLFYSYGDVIKMKRFVEIENNPDQTSIYMNKLQQMGKYGDLNSCRRRYLLTYFDEQTSQYCGNCDICLSRFEQIDCTSQANLALTAVLDLKELYGADFVIDFLRGSNSRKIRDYQKKLGAYGSGGEYARDAWKQFFADLLHDGYLEKTTGIYPVLKLTGKSRRFMEHGGKALFTKRKQRIEKVAEPAIVYEVELFDRLKSVRRDLALLENVPAYVVVSDATLMELATYLPNTPEGMRKIPGFSETKIERYGEHFRIAVVGYCAEKQMPTKIHLKKTRIERKEKIRYSDTRQESYDMFKSGKPIKQIADIRGLKSGTIETHLSFFVEQGELPIEDVLSKGKLNAIEKAIDRSSSVSIGRLKEQLGIEYGYGEIRMVLAHRNFIQQALEVQD